MENENLRKVIYIVVNAGFADEVMEIARDAGAHGATIMNARGEGSRHKSLMGITFDSEKEIILILTEDATAQAIMQAVKEKAGIDTPARGICFTLPVEATTMNKVAPAE